MKIHLDTDQVWNLAAKVKDLSHFLYHSTDDLESKVNQTDWTGLSANDYFVQAHAAGSKISTIAEEIAKTYLELNREIHQWVDVDEQGVNRLKRVILPPKAKEDPTLGMYVDHYSDLFENRRYNKEYQEFVKWWKDRSLEERKQYLQQLQERMADRLGMPRVLVGFDDLPDSTGGDAKGVNIGGVLMVDVDNLTTEDPWRLIETVFHETRHEYQREVVSNYQNTGVIPEGLTQRQIEKWGNEFENYIGGEDSFKDYYNQAIERDARDFGDDVMKDVLSEMGQGGGAW